MGKTSGLVQPEQRHEPNMRFRRRRGLPNYGEVLIAFVMSHKADQRPLERMVSQRREHTGYRRRLARW